MPNSLIERIEAIADCRGGMACQCQERLRNLTSPNMRLIATALRAARAYFADLYVVEESTGVVDDLRSALVPIFGSPCSCGAAEDNGAAHLSSCARFGEKP